MKLFIVEHLGGVRRKTYFFPGIELVGGCSPAASRRP
jgi:hypothetical protein